MQPSVKHGGASVLDYGCITVISVSDISFLSDGIMNAENCKQVLIHHAGPPGMCLIRNCFIFQYNNDPKHNTPGKSYLKRKKTTHKILMVVDLPPQRQT